MSLVPLCRYRGPVAVARVAETHIMVEMFTESPPGASSVSSSTVIVENYPCNAYILFELTSLGGSFRLPSTAATSDSIRH